MKHQEQSMQQIQLQATALEMAANPILITRCDGTIQWVNPAFSALTGYTREEIVGQTPRVLKSGKLDSDYYRQVWETVLSGKSWHGEFINRRKDGGLYEVEQTITPVRSDSGAITHFIGVAIDITQRKAREYEIARLNRLYAVLSEVNQAVLHARSREELLGKVCRAAVELGGFRLAWVGWHDPQSRAIRPIARAGVGAGFIENVVLSSDPSELPGRGPTGTALREGRAAIVNDIAQDELAAPWRDRAVDHGLRATGAFPVRCGGEICAVFCVYAGEPGEFGEKEVRLLVEVAEDVSFALDHLESEARRRQMEAHNRHLATVVDASADAIVSRTLDGIITTWNQGAEKIYGYTSAEIVGRSQKILVPPDRAAEIDGIDAKLHRGESIPVFETVRRRKDGRVIQVAITVAPLRDDAERVTGAATVARDITEQKDLAAQFLRAQRLESIGELAGGVAHDLNNILTPIGLGVPLLRPEVASTHAHNLLDVIEASVARGTQITRQILSFARGAEATKRPVQTRHLVRELAEMLVQTLPKSISVEGSFPPDLWPMDGDPTSLHQMFMNLCVNARDAMPRGGVLTLRGENVQLDADTARRVPEAKAGRYVVWTIADTGAGISPANLEKIFEPFFTTKEPGKGTGLGLSTVRRVVRDHGGFIHVASRDGEGTQFQVYFPATEFEVPRPEPAHSLLPSGHGELVLLVDDEYSVRHMIEHVLRAHDYRILAVDSGVQAQALFREHASEISLLVTDLVMPGMSGVELTHLLRGLEPKLKVVAISGLVDRSDGGASTMEVYADGFLHKPFAIDELLTMVADVLKSGRNSATV